MDPTATQYYLVAQVEEGASVINRSFEAGLVAVLMVLIGLGVFLYLYFIHRPRVERQDKAAQEIEKAESEKRLKTLEKHHAVLEKLEVSKNADYHQMTVLVGQISEILKTNNGKILDVQKVTIRNQMQLRALVNAKLKVIDHLLRNTEDRGEREELQNAKRLLEKELMRE